MFIKITDFLLDLLAPRRCLCCHVYDTWLCDTCCNSLMIRVDQTCHYCKKIHTPYGNLCTDCRGASPLRSIFVATNHTGAQKQLLSRIVHHYKYYFIKTLAQPLGKVLTHNLTDAALPLPDIIIPVPLHARRLRWRGFNQADFLADALQSHLTQHLPIFIAKDLLIRTRYTRPQVTKTNRTARLHNLHDAFHVVDTDAIVDKHVLLVDDIATTGSTLIECATALKNAGATSIDAIVLSRG